MNKVKRLDKHITNTELQEGYIPVEALQPTSSWHYISKQQGWIK